MATRTKVKPTAAAIKAKYIDHLLAHGEQPKTVYAFAKTLDITEAEFYAFYSSFEVIEQQIWEDFMRQTIDTIKADEGFENFAVRDKLLTFFFAHMEILLAQRSYVTMRAVDLRKPGFTPVWLKTYRKAFEVFAQELISEGIAKNEIKERQLISNSYRGAMWLQLLFVLDFWVRDRSAGFEHTDAAIEKAVNLAFQLLGESSIDSALDLAKFLWQSK